MQVARRIALNTQDLLTGSKADSLSTSLDVVDRLKIKARTARAVGWNIGLENSLQADILHAGVLADQGSLGQSRPELSMEQAMRLAAKAHPDVGQMESEADSARARFGQAAGGLWPQIEARAQSRRIDADRAEASLLDKAWVALNQAMGQGQSRRWSVPEGAGGDPVLVSGALCPDGQNEC